MSNIYIEIQQQLSGSLSKAAMDKMVLLAQEGLTKEEIILQLNSDKSNFVPNEEVNQKTEIESGLTAKQVINLGCGIAIAILVVFLPE